MTDRYSVGTGRLNTVLDHEMGVAYDLDSRDGKNNLVLRLNKFDRDENSAANFRSRVCSALNLPDTATDDEVLATLADRATWTV